MPEIILDPLDLRPLVRVWSQTVGPAGGVVGPRRIRDHEFVLIHEDGSWYQHEEGRVELRAGDLVLVRPQMLHSFHWSPQGTLHSYVHFDFDSAHRQPAGLLRLAGARPFPLVLHVGLESPCAAILTRWLGSVGEAPFNQLRWRAGLLELLAALGAGPLQGTGAPLLAHGAPASVVGHAWGAAPTGTDLLRVQQALRALDERLADPNLTAGELAATVNISEPHFRRLCRKLTGYSPVQQMLRRRIARARALLLDSSLTITELAQRCGFSDARYFSRAFRKAEGVSPGEYRDSVLRRA